MENIDKNADILTILDGYKAYAADYEERKKKEEEEQKRNAAEERKVIEENLRKKNIQEEIAETLRKIKEQEAEDAKVNYVFTFFNSLYIENFHLYHRNLKRKEKGEKRRKEKRKK